MHPDALYPRCLAAILHFVIQKALGIGKEPVVLLQPVAMGHILLQTVAKTVGNGDSADAFRRFRRGDNILSAEALIALVHRQGFLFKVDIRRCECQQLSLPNPRVVHGHEYRVAGRPVFHDLNEGLKLLPCPEQHFIGMLLTHTSRFVAWILFQSIILDRVVENCRELVVDALEIGLGVRLAAFIAVAGQRVLPLAHMSGLDLVQRDFLEEGRYLQVDQPFLAGNGGGLEAVLHILDIQSDEVAEGHTEAARGLADEVTFPLKGFFFSGEAALLFVDCLSRPVRYPDLRHPATGIAVFCY